MQCETMLAVLWMNKALTDTLCPVFVAWFNAETPWRLSNLCWMLVSQHTKANKQNQSVQYITESHLILGYWNKATKQNKAKNKMPLNTGLRLSSFISQSCILPVCTSQPTLFMSEGVSSSSWRPWQAYCACVGLEFVI